MKRTELKRKTPIRKKAVRPRRKPAVTCARRGCKRRPAVLDLCKTHGKQECDRLFSLAVRAVGKCARCQTTNDLQCSHIVSRRYLAVRWDFRNAECMCRGCHRWQHLNPLENESELEERLSPTRRTSLRVLALDGPKPVLAEVLTDLRAAQNGVDPWNRNR